MMSSSGSYWDHKPAKRGLDRYRAESPHGSDKLYPHNGYLKGYDQSYLNREFVYSHGRPYYDTTRSETSDKRTKEPKRVSDVFHRFSDTTSLQGIPFITAASRWYAKLLWSCIFLAATGVWILHSVVLIQNYIQFDTTSQVKISRDKLDFPTITLCNINPIRENTIDRYGDERLQELLDLLRPRTEYYPTRRKKRQTVDEEENIDRDHDFSVFTSLNWTWYSDVGAFGEYLNDGYSSTYLAKLLLREMLVQFPDHNRTQMGHRLGDMMLGCSYDGKTCNAMNFTRFLDISYGNCFSFNSADLYDTPLESSSSGSSYGLDIVLYIQNREYMKGIQQGRGIRLDVHPYGTQPFVEEGGISIPTGFQTYLSIRQIKQTRLGGKYDKCDDDGTYAEYYDNYLYTLEGCTQTCVDRTISSTCGCYRGSRKQFYNQHDLKNLLPCSSASELNCQQAAENDYDSEKYDCNCNQACKTTEYDYLLSYDQWPDSTLWHSLTDAVCVSVTEGECDTVQMTEEDDRENFLSKNFIHLKIYYRDLNIEYIKETAAYEDIQFYSDIGGAIGLWLGASVITLFELLDLSFRAVQFCCKRKTYQKRRQLQQHQQQQLSQLSQQREEKGRAYPPSHHDARSTSEEHRSGYGDHRSQHLSRHRGHVS